MDHKTHTIDASGRILGRLATEIANLLRGKNKPDFLPHKNTGDPVTVKNVDKIIFTGKKLDKKRYYRHSGYPGGIKEVVYKDIFSKDPNEVLRRAVYGMLPRNKLRVKMMRRLKLYQEDQYGKN